MKKIYQKPNTEMIVISTTGILAESFNKYDAPTTNAVKGNLSRDGYDYWDDEEDEFDEDYDY